MTTDALDPAVLVFRFNAALAEVGYPGKHLWYDEIFGQIFGNPAAPKALVWQAFAVAKGGLPHPCWSCWDASFVGDSLVPQPWNWASDCVTGRLCRFPNGPARPPRELLVAT